MSAEKRMVPGEDLFSQAWARTEKRPNLLSRIRDFRVPDFKHKLLMSLGIHQTGNEVEKRIKEGTLFVRPEPPVQSSPIEDYRFFWAIGALGYMGYVYIPPKENNYG